MMTSSVGYTGPWREVASACGPVGQAEHDVHVRNGTNRTLGDVTDQ